MSTPKKAQAPKKAPAKKTPAKAAPKAPAKKEKMSPLGMAAVGGRPAKTKPRNPGMFIINRGPLNVLDVQDDRVKHTDKQFVNVKVSPVDNPGVVFWMRCFEEDGIKAIKEAQAKNRPLNYTLQARRWSKSTLVTEVDEVTGETKEVKRDLPQVSYELYRPNTWEIKGTKLASGKKDIEIDGEVVPVSKNEVYFEGSVSARSVVAYQNAEGTGYRINVAAGGHFVSIFLKEEQMNDDLKRVVSDALDPDNPRGSYISVHADGYFSYDDKYGVQAKIGDIQASWLTFAETPVNDHEESESEDYSPTM